MHIEERHNKVKKVYKRKKTFNGTMQHSCIQQCKFLLFINIKMQVIPTDFINPKLPQNKK